MRAIVVPRWYLRQLHGVKETPSGCRILAPGLVQARGNSWDRLIFEDLVKFS